MSRFKDKVERTVTEVVDTEGVVMTSVEVEMDVDVVDIVVD